MTALVGGLGPDWVRREVDVPTPRPGQLLIRVRAAGLNRADLHMLQGTYNPGGKRRPTFTAGLELAGEVAVVGADVGGFEVGDRVMGTTLGAFAPFALVDHRHVVPGPASLSWTDAAALPVGLTTEHDALVTQGGLASGQVVLVTGGSSGVGLVGVQLAKALGASMVFATTTSASKVDAVLDAGADHVIDTSREQLSEAVLALTDGVGVDVALDHVGGELVDELLAATRPLGTIVNIGRLGGSSVTIDLDTLAFRRIRLIGTTFSIRTAEERGQVAAALIPEVLPALSAGRIRPIVDSVFAFDDAHLAADRLRSNDAIGKVVLEMPA
jgi:NADPH:quinone reductase-like Zn-dependent oxidoreductase